MMVLIWTALAGAQTPTQIEALLLDMEAGVAEIETLREKHTEESVRTCIDTRLIPMRALVEIATTARSASLAAERQGMADLEARKVAVAANQLEVQRAAARRCVPVDARGETVVDCPECPESAPETEETEADAEALEFADGSPGSPFE